jgi:hypothetical protein
VGLAAEVDGPATPAQRVNWTRTILLEAPSQPNPAGPTHTVQATATDRAGNTHTATLTITVTHQPP